MDGLTILRLISFVFAGSAIIWIVRAPARQPIHIATLLHMGSMMLASFYGAFGGWLGPVAPAIHLAGIASCGWFWLFSRVLFRQGETIKLWMIGVVALITLPFGLDKIFAAAPWMAEAFKADGLLRMAYNIEALTSSTVLALGVMEAPRSFEAQSAEEKRFRKGFVLLFGGLIGLSMIWLQGSPETSFAGRAGDAFRAGFMMIAVIGSVYAVKHRLRVPLARPDTASTSRRAQTALTAPTDDDKALAARVTAYVSDPRVFTLPEIKVATIAEELGAPEYKVTRAISRATDFPNFNRLINHHRIALARRRLSTATERHTSILVIAMESGFGSIGPFNRAFKEIVGETPRAFRAAQLAAPSPPSTQAGSTSAALS
ncbi:MAG: helix-turn-helix domain-containing protein [Pseudomonadota bacterium]